MRETYDLDSLPAYVDRYRFQFDLHYRYQVLSQLQIEADWERQRNITEEDKKWWDDFVAKQPKRLPGGR